MTSAYYIHAKKHKAVQSVITKTSREEASQTSDREIIDVPKQ